MPKTTYNKLIRDKIPEIIENDGKKAVTYQANETEFIDKLNEKLKEECLEYLKSQEIEELADVIEVIEALLKAKNISWEEIIRIKSKKQQARGGFDKRIILKTVE